MAVSDMQNMLRLIKKLLQLVLLICLFIQNGKSEEISRGHVIL